MAITLLGLQGPALWLLCLLSRGQHVTPWCPLPSPPLPVQTVKPKLSEEQKANLRMCFKMMDADGSGNIDAQELDAAFKLLGLKVSRREVEAMLAEVDRDGSGAPARVQGGRQGF